jgi:arabinose-5-phosphate isomerase
MDKDVQSRRSPVGESEEGRAVARILDEGKCVIRLEAEALVALETRLGAEFEEAVRVLARCLARGGRVVITGVGKSGLIGQKIAATFNSTGTPAFFLHPTEGLHGDLGMVTSRDTVVAISKSGRSDEIHNLLPWLKRLSVKIVALTGDPGSPLAQSADIVLDTGVEREACPLGLAPTASSTAALAMGDALAVALFRIRGLDARDFAYRHPGGVIGRRLNLRVKEIMHSGDRVPKVAVGSRLRDAILEIIEKRLGVTTVVSEDGRLVGLIADGDLKRILVRTDDFMDAPVEKVMTPDPRTIGSEDLVSRALQRMEEDPQRLITSLVVVDDERRPIGIIHIHDCLRAGIS